MDALTSQSVQVDRQGRDEGLTLTRLHLRDPSEVQRHAAHQLDVVVALTENSRRRLSHDREGFDQEVVEGLPLGEPFTEHDGLVTQLLVGQAGHLTGEVVDGRH